MHCERCKKTDATIHLTEIIKDVKSEVHLCEECARDIGLNTKLSGFSLSVPEMLSFLEVNEVSPGEETGSCKMCGTRFVQYIKNGKLGCPDCYTYLEGSLESVIKSYHGNTIHVGKIPASFDEKKHEIVEHVESPVISLGEMQQKLDQAVTDERYEDAALLRDKIRQAMKS